MNKNLSHEHPLSSVSPRWIGNRAFISIIFLTILLSMALFSSGVVAKSPARQDELPTIKIGYLGSPTSDLFNGISLAVAQINAAGGSVLPDNSEFNFELVIAEVNPDDPNSVTLALQNLVNQDVVAIFGPDSDTLTIPNVPALSAAPVPIFTGATGETVLNLDTNGNIFRIAAQESVYSTALAGYLTEELGLTRIVVIQTQIEWSEAIITLGNILNQVGIVLTPGETLIQAETSEALLTSIVTLPEDDPEAVVFYGDAENAMTVLEQLRANNWQGVFVYRTAQESLVGNDFANGSTAGLLGVDNWTFGANDQLGTVFITEYVGQYGRLPGPLAAGGYDTLFALDTVISRLGIDPAQLRQGLSQLRLNLVRGPLDPASYGNRNLSRTAFIYELTGQGGVRAIAVYDNGVLRAEAGFGGTQVGFQPTATLLPSPTPSATATATPAFSTPTPSVLTATVNTSRLNVRSGPGTNYEPPIGQLVRGDQAPVIGANADSTWYVINYRGAQGWISADLVTIFDPASLRLSLPIVPAPPTPTPGPTPIGPDPDVVIVTANLSVPQPEPGVAFTANVLVKNQGGSATGSFVVATNFRPDEAAVVSVTVPPLAAGQQTSVTLGPATLTQTGWVPDLAIIADFNQNVAEGTLGETNNVFLLPYKVDEPVFVQNQIVLNPAQTFDFWGGSIDTTWDGTNFVMSTNGRIGLVTTNTFQTAYFGLASGVATLTSYANPPVGSVFAIKTEEGLFGFMQVDARTGGQITITYRVYNP